MIIKLGLDVLLLVAAMVILSSYWPCPFSAIVGASSNEFVIAKENCSDICSSVDVKIPYPFGIGSLDCAKNESFFLNCNQSGLYFMQNLSVSDISLEKGTFTIGLTSAYECFNQSGLMFEPVDQSIDLQNSSFTISPTYNKLTALGCDTAAGMNNNNSNIRGTLSFCDTASELANVGSCSGRVCSQTAIPANVRTMTIWVSSLFNHNNSIDFNPCGYAFVTGIDFNISSVNLSAETNLSSVPISLVELEWVVGDDQNNCQASEGSSGYSCSANAVCSYSQTGGGSICSCSQGYSGNPYLPQGCQDIDECSLENRSKYPCYGKCKNTIGNYSCRCPLGMYGDGKIGCKGLHLSIIIAIVIGAVIFLVMVYYCSIFLLQYLSKMWNKHKYFRENKGMMMKAQRIRIFSEAELEKATNKYDRNHFLGEGGFGTVYKGVLAEDMLVAIKKPKGKDKVIINQEFQQEMAIVSQVNHKNVVKILGLCLETRVPMLVYEFISNGTLYHHIHDKRSHALNLWRNRLRIASEVADALNYLHSLANPPIIHGDVKSMNILLDDHYIAKVSDFGASVLTSPNQVLMGSKVQGTLGYLDPEYLMTGCLTEKSDVYSFAVVLVELLTGEKPTSSMRAEEKRNLVQYFISAVENHRIIYVLNFEPEDDGEIEEVELVAELAKRCLNGSGLRRPSMREVAEELGRLKRLNNNFFPQHENEETEHLLGESSHTFNDFSTGTMDLMESHSVHSTFDIEQASTGGI